MKSSVSVPIYEKLGLRRGRPDLPARAQVRQQGRHGRLVQGPPRTARDHLQEVVFEFVDAGFQFLMYGSFPRAVDVISGKPDVAAEVVGTGTQHSVITTKAMVCL